MPLENNPKTGMRPQPPAIDDPPASGGTRSPMRPQPPGIRDPKRSEAPSWSPGEEGSDEQDTPDRDRWKENTAGEDDNTEDEYEGPEQPDWEQRAKDAERFSTNYLDSNYRQQWDDSLRAFNNQHPSDSKYNSENFRKRSHFYNPAVRTVIRKNEAAAAQAFFSNQDLLSVQPMNQADAKQRLSADLNKELLQWRLKHSIPWFQVLIGGLQDAQTMGACVAHVFWEYQSVKDQRGQLKVHKDRPQVKLDPLENFRFDPSANWMDPVNTSPYWIHLIPMYLGDVREKMAHPDPKGRQWHHYGDQEMLTAENPDDSTRSARLGNQQDPAQEKRTISDYEVVWVRRHIHRWRGSDWEFYALPNGKLLTDPEPLEKTVFHGLRPYVMGLAHLETHKVIPSSVPTMTRQLTEKLNAIENQRNDNVLFVLNKRHAVKRGTNVDTASLVRNVPGGIVMLDNMDDLKELTWPDVTASAYQEADQARRGFDDLVGNFNPMQMHQAGAPREAQGTVAMLKGPSSVLTDFMLMTYSITFAEPVIRQLILLEQHYETDANILSIAGEKAKAYQKFGVDEVTDDMLDQELSVTVNCGMGATDTIAKLQRFTSVVITFANIAAKPPPGVNLSEVWKELCALAGYQDGARFSVEQNPELAKLMQQNKALTQMVQDLKRHKQDKHESNVVKLVTAREQIASKERIAQKDKEHQTQLIYGQHLLEQDNMMLQAAMTPEPQPGAAGQPQGGATPGGGPKPQGGAGSPPASSSAA